MTENCIPSKPFIPGINYIILYHELQPSTWFIDLYLNLCSLYTRPDHIGQVGEPRRMDTNPLQELVEAESLINKQLTDFQIAMRTEVYKANDVDGRPAISLGFFQNASVAEAWAQDQVGGVPHHTRQVLVLVNDPKKIGFIIGAPALIVDEAEMIKEVRDTAIAKLSPAQRAVLKL